MTVTGKEMEAEDIIKRITERKNNSISSESDYSSDEGPQMSQVNFPQALAKKGMRSQNIKIKPDTQEKEEANYPESVKVELPSGRTKEENEDIYEETCGKGKTCSLSEYLQFRWKGNPQELIQALNSALSAKAKRDICMSLGFPL